MEFDTLLKLMVEKGASDLFITAGVPPSMKIHGKIVDVTKSPLSPEKARELTLSVMTEKQKKKIELEQKENSESNTACSFL